MNTDKHRFKPGRPVFLCSQICLLLLTASAFASDQHTVQHTIDHTTIRVGDPVKLTLTAFCPTNAVIDFPELEREKEIVVLKRNWEQMDVDTDLPRVEMRYTLTSFRLGEHALSTNAIICRTMDGVPVYTSAFPNVTLTVDTSLDESASSEIADIRPMHRLPGRIPLWLFIIPGAALIAFIIGLITSMLWKNRKKLVPKPPPLQPHIVAFQSLEALKNKGLLEKDECNPFYTELSIILRTYLEGRFQLNAPDETTEEIVEEMSTSSELNGTQRNILQDFMRQADMVKFAKGHPDRQTMEAAFSTTTQFVQETKTEGGQGA